MESVSMTIDKLFPTQIEPGSIADRLLKKGREEGREEGRDQGLLEGEIKLIRTLQEILGMGVSDASNLQGRSLEQLQNLALELRKQIQNRTP
jgi:predicted transposase YdaD